MRIGLIADTHIPDSDQKLPFEIYHIFKGVDLIIHAGDIYSVSVLDDLEKIAPVKSARGDDDWIVDDQRLEDRLLLTIEGRSIRVEHQFAVLNFYSKGFIGLEDVAEKIKEYPDLPDILIFGHSHKPLTLEMEDTLFINPGSATYPDHNPGLGTVAILTISAVKVDVQTIPLAEII